MDLAQRADALLIGELALAGHIYPWKVRTDGEGGIYPWKVKAELAHG
ncbi:MAG: hypothetical protein AB7T06_23165 [Kofleriaceae bacterium]